MKAFRIVPQFLPNILNPNLFPITFPKPLHIPVFLSPLSSTISTFRSVFSSSSSTPSMAESGNLTPFDGTLGTQFESFRTQLDETSNLRERIRNVALEIESVTRIMHANLLLVHQSRPVSEVLEKAKSQIGPLKEHFNRLAEIIRDCPGQYYRYHNDWKNETQTVVSLLAFMHWLETGNLLLHPEAQEKLGLNTPDFGLDVEDYLVGICFMSNELPRYVINRVTYGDYDSPRKVLNFLTDLHAAFRMLNLRNDFLRKKFDGMKYDLKRVEEVFYDVKIRGLIDNEDSKGDQGSKEQP
ncbi:translin-like [Chenopodium quinoa]|uniref:Translin n=1 Tax=Chenopodium quinoa TaxID=63459 RepID=A0A803N4U4_CHEQI|nr:translin-like [Chenopodium quinoa]